MNIIGDKTVLRAVELQDKEILLELINDPETEKMIGGKSFPVSPKEQEQWIDNLTKRKEELRCIITEKGGSGKGLGTVILSDLDYINGTAQVHIKMVKEEGRRNGFGTDALNAIIAYGFAELRLNCIYAEVLSYNLISKKLFEKCGFHKDGILRSRVYKNMQYIDVVTYSLLKTDDK